IVVVEHPIATWCRLFEVPARRAANSVQELQIDKRHWQYENWQCPYLFEVRKGGCREQHTNFEKWALRLMPKTKSFLRLFTEGGPLIALAVALLLGVAAPASAQFFFNFGGPRQPPPQQRAPGGWFGGEFFAPFQQQQPQRVENYSKAPPPAKRETVPER